MEKKINEFVEQTLKALDISEEILLWYTCRYYTTIRIKEK